jgi:hypothetical protein
MPPATTTKAPAPKPLNVTGTPTPGKISPSPSADSAAEGSTGLAPAAGLIKAEDISSPHELTAFVSLLSISRLSVLYNPLDLGRIFVRAVGDAI